MQPDTEHQQHHPHFGQLGCNLSICNKAGGGWPDGDTSKQISHQRREFQLGSDKAKKQRQPESGGKGRDETDGVMQMLVSFFNVGYATVFVAPLMFCRAAYGPA